MLGTTSAINNDGKNYQADRDSFYEITVHLRAAPSVGFDTRPCIVSKRGIYFDG
jgi:hypothetical protein